MLRTRLWMGAILIGVAVLLLLEDRWFAPWFPILYVCFFGATLLASREFLNLLPEDVRPCEWLTMTCVLVVMAMNWWPAFQATRDGPPGLGVWDMIGLLTAASIIATILREMWLFQGPSRITIRVGLVAFILFYLGVLPSFLAQLRWLPDDHATIALALAVFVPKGNDIGAYFTGKFLTGRILGRHKMTPLLSPKKTWQGLIGGMIVSAGVAIGINQFWPVLPGGILGSIAFGLCVGTAGVLGDLAESLIKRDLQTKDTSRSVPGFGGVLDVVDSLLFAAPVVYLWFRFFV